MTTTLERAARAVWDEIAHQNGENTSGYTGTYAGRPDYVEGFIDASALVRAVLMAVRVPGIDTHNAGAFSDGQAKEPTLKVGPNGVVMIDWQSADPSKMFTAMIDDILKEPDQ